MAEIIPLFKDDDMLTIEDNAEALRVLCDALQDVIDIPPVEMATLVLDVDGRRYTAFEIINKAASGLCAYAGLIDMEMQK